MDFERRKLLQAAAAGAASAALPRSRAGHAAPRTLKAIAFDGFVIFDPRPAAALAETLYPGKGAGLVGAWRTRLFEYQWLRTLSGRYADFEQTCDAALRFAAGTLRLELPPERHAALLRAHTDLVAWPDAAAGLRELKARGLRLALCSNMSSRMLDEGLRKAGLGHLFEASLSADRVRAHKPDPRAYAMATEALRLEREEVLFAAFAAWDVAGATWFGYPTYWVNRAHAAPEELDAPAVASGPTLEDLARHVAQREA